MGAFPEEGWEIGQEEALISSVKERLSRKVKKKELDQVIAEENKEKEKEKEQREKGSKKGKRKKREIKEAEEERIQEGEEGGTKEREKRERLLVTERERAFVDAFWCWSFFLLWPFHQRSFLFEPSKHYILAVCF